MWRLPLQAWGAEIEMHSALRNGMRTSATRSPGYGAGRLSVPTTYMRRQGLAWRPARCGIPVSQGRYAGVSQGRTYTMPHTRRTI